MSDRARIVGEPGFGFEEPSTDCGVSARAQLRDGVLRLYACASGRGDEAVSSWIDPERVLMACDDPELDAVAQTVECSGGRRLRGRELAGLPSHRARDIDHDDLGSRGRGRVRTSGAHRSDAHDGVDCGGAGRQVLVVIGVGPELGHDASVCGDLSGNRTSTTATVTLSDPPRAMA